MFLLWILFFVLLLGTGIVLVKKYEPVPKENGWFEFGAILIFITSVILVIMTFIAITDHFEIKEEIIKIQVIQDVIQSDNVLDLKDVDVIPKLSPDILLEKKIEYNEKIIGWQNDNKWWKSDIYIPDTVDSLELIK